MDKKLKHKKNSKLSQDDGKPPLLNLLFFSFYFQKWMDYSLMSFPDFPSLSFTR